MSESKRIHIWDAFEHVHKTQQSAFVLLSKRTRTHLGERIEELAPSRVSMKHRTHSDAAALRFTLTWARWVYAGAFQLKAASDFILNVSCDRNGILQASVKCNCNRRFVLSTSDTKIQVSNIQENLQTSTCYHMKEMRKRFKEHQKLVTQQSSNIEWDK